MAATPATPDFVRFLLPISSVITSTMEKKTTTNDQRMENETTPGDQRATVLNPTSVEHKAAGDNRSNQLNPNNAAYRSSRGRK